MPQVVAGWIIASAGGVAAVGTVGAALIQAGAALAFNYAVSKIFAPKGPKPRDLQTELRQSDAPMVRYLGNSKAAGAVMYWDWRAVENRRRLYKLVAVGAGGITAVAKWWINDKEVAATDGAVTTAPQAGNVQLHWRMGRDTQLYGGAYSQMTDPLWTADHRLEEVGTILALFDAPSPEDFPTVFPGGGNDQVMILFSGDKARHPDGTTYGHTVNLARHVYDILIHPKWGICTAADIDLPSFAQAVADCNEAVALKAGGTLARYAGGGGYRLDESIADVTQRWLDGMAGQIYVTTEGKIGLRAGKWRAPTYTITEDKIVSMEYGAGSGAFEPVTTLEPTYTAPEADWQTTNADPWDDPAALARYGEVTPKELPLPVVQHHGQARRLAKIKIAKLNPKYRFTIRLRLWGLLLIEEETVSLTLPRLGINAQPFWIDSFAMDMDGEDGVVVVELIHARPESFDWNPATEEGEPPATPPPPTTPGLEGPVTITSVTVVTGDGPPLIRVAYTRPVGRVVIVQYRRHGVMTDPWSTMTMEGGGGVARTGGLSDATSYDLRYAPAKSAFGNPTPAGPWSYIDDVQVVANPNPPAAPVVVSSSGTAGGAFSVTFEPAVGVNYKKTSLYRAAVGATFPDAVKIKESTATSAQVTLTDTVPIAGARYWLRSENESGVASASVLVTAIAGLTVADSFNRADGSAVSADWTQLAGASAPQIVGNALQLGAVEAEIIQHAADLGTNHYAEVQALGASGATGGYRGVAVLVRISGPGDWYMLRLAGTAWLLEKSVAGTITQLATGAAGAVPQTIRLSVTGSTLTASVAGTVVATVTDTTHATGTRAGIRLAIQPGGFAPNIRADNFAAGTV